MQPVTNQILMSVTHSPGQTDGQSASPKKAWHAPQVSMLKLEQTFKTASSIEDDIFDTNAS